jgi:chromosome segregation protein
MRIERLCLERYGAFTDRVLEFRPDAALHIVLGANEAGKTSALSAIGDLLFGFGHNTSFDFLHEKAALRLGARVRLANGVALEFRRRKGTKNTLLDAEERPLADDLLTSALGAVTREIFSAEFGLTSEALRAGGRDLLQKGGRLAETLAASSAQLSALTRLRAKLDDEAEALFGTRRADSKPFYAALKRHEDARRRLAECIVSPEALRVAEATVATAEEQKRALAEAYDRLGRDIALRQRALRTRPKLARLDMLREALAALSDLPPVDAQTLATWRDAAQEFARLGDDLAHAHAQIAASGSAIEALSIDEAVISKARDIEALREQLGGVREAEKDLPSRRTRLRTARGALDDLARRLGLEDCDALLARQPTDAALARADALIDARVDAERRLAEAREAQRAAERQAQELDAAAARHETRNDPAPLRRRFELFADAPAEAERLRRGAFAQDNARARLVEDIARLDPRVSLDELTRLPLPEANAVEAFRRRMEDEQEEERRAQGELRSLRTTVAAIEQEIVGLQSGGDLATRADLEAIRAKRDEAHRRLGDWLEGPQEARTAAFAALEDSHRALDTTTDRLLGGAERAARFDAAKERRAKEQHAHESLALGQDARHAARAATQQEWRAHWASCGLEPKSPQAMSGWLTSANALLARRREIEDAQVEFSALAATLEERCGGLLRLAEELAEPADATLPVEALYKLLRATLEKRSTEWTEARSTVALLVNAREGAARAAERYATIAHQLEAATTVWPETLAAIGLAGDAAPAEARAALAVWREAPLHRATLNEEQHRIDAMQANIGAFETAVGALVAEVAPDLDLLAPREALTALAAALKQSQAALEQRNAQKAAARKWEETRRGLSLRRESAAQILAVARAALALAEDEPLAPVMEKVSARIEAAQKLVEAERDLGESADGHSEDALREEQRDLGGDTLASEIERLTMEQRQSLADLTEAAKRAHDAAQAREELALGRDAAGAASEKAEAAAELLDVAQRWLVRAAAARLATRAIERHRAAVQDPLIAHASTLFAIATDGAFRSLGVDYDKDDAPTLVGLRASGARTPVAGMSEGTRDQLFLSLRLALLELRAAEPLPFVGDDLLASFDDERARRALELLVDFGRGRQAILFTHHRHIVEIAAGLKSPSIDVVTL